jgi:hypothetical protein
MSEPLFVRKKRMKEWGRRREGGERELHCCAASRCS